MLESLRRPRRAPPGAGQGARAAPRRPCASPASSRSPSRPGCSWASARRAQDRSPRSRRSPSPTSATATSRRSSSRTSCPKPRTAMAHGRRAPSDEEFHWTIAAARLVLPDDVHLQAPPNLVDDPTRLLDFGIDDFGGISPVTLDHVNPERAWPALDSLATRRRARGLQPGAPAHRLSRVRRARRASSSTSACGQACSRTPTPRSSARNDAWVVRVGRRSHRRRRASRDASTGRSESCSARYGPG